MNVKDHLDDLYIKDEEPKTYIIQVAIDNYTDIFNDLDPTPFEVRDLDPNLRHYIYDCSTDIPLNYDLKIQFKLPKNHSDCEKEIKIVRGIHKYYSYLTDTSKDYNKNKLKKNVLNILIATFLLFVSFLLKTVISDNIVLLVLLEGLYIGGWEN